MSVFAIILSPFFTLHHDQEHLGDSECPEKAPGRGVEPRVDDKEFGQAIDPQDADEDEPDEPSPPGRRVTFGITSGGPTPLPVQAPAKQGPPARLKATLFPTPEEKKPSSRYRIIPVISGLVIPFSILLEIPALTDSWYTRTDRNVVVESRRNTAGVNVMLAMSMFFALVANCSLVCRFLEKGPVLGTTLITMASLTIHDSINIIAVVVFGVQRRFDDGFTYGHGYWMTVLSTGVSTATNISLIWDLIWTRNFSKNGSGVSRKQRSLLIIVMFLLVYIAFGALVNSILIGLDFIDSLYFTVVSIETIGFGDITPKDTGARIFICFYIIFGVINLGAAIGVARETIFEHLQHSYQRRLTKIRRAYQERRDWRIWERKWKMAVEWRLRDINAEIWMPDFTEDTESMVGVIDEEPKWIRVMQFISRIFHRRRKYRNCFRDEGEIRGVDYGHPRTHLNVEALSRAQMEAAAVESGVPLCVVRALQRRRAYLSRTHTIASQSSASTTQYWSRWFWSEREPLPTERPTTQFMKGLEDISGMLTKFAIATTGAGVNGVPERPSEPSLDVQRSYTLDSSVSDIPALSSVSRAIIHEDFQEIASGEERKAFWAKLVVAWSLFMTFWLFGAALFVATEKWTYGVAFYFCFITFTTTGYGDSSPKTASGRSVFAFWALLGLATMTILVSVLQDAFSSKYKSAVHSGVFENAVKKYRKNMKNQSKNKAKEEIHEEFKIPIGAQQSLVEGQSTRARRDLEMLPGRVLDQARVFHRYIHYLVQAEPGGTVFPDLKLMLDDIGRGQKLDERMKVDILQDKEARNTICMLSIEKALRELVDVAESAQLALAERDLTTVECKEGQQVVKW